MRDLLSKVDAVDRISQSHHHLSFILVLPHFLIDHSSTPGSSYLHLMHRLERLALAPNAPSAKHCLLQSVVTWSIFMATSF